MPFPVAHSLVGASVAAAWRPQDSIGRDWKILLFAALLAVCPDFDFFLCGYCISAEAGTAGLPIRSLLLSPPDA